jgi:hypothetical protein
MNKVVNSVMQLAGDNSDGHHDIVEFDFNEDPMLSSIIIGAISIMVWMWGFFVMFPDQILGTCNY